MRIYIIAGEKSGDFIGARLISSLKTKSKENQIEFRGVGGYEMQKEGLKSLFPIEKINLMGFLEIIPHIFSIKKLIDKTVQDILDFKPNIIVTIDSPGFTYRVAKKIKKLDPDIGLVHVVAPSVWAYKPNRAQKYADIYDYLLTLLPFEPSYFLKLNLPAFCIGHPIFEQKFYSHSKSLCKDLGINDECKIISVTPGSRKGEIKRHMPIITEAMNKLALKSKIQVIFVQSDESNNRLISEFLSSAKFNYIFSTDRLKSFAVSDCALAKSGTNTLEIAASGVPMVVGYKLNPITFFILKKMIKVKYASLINIIPNKEIIPELIQSNFNAENIANSLYELLNDKEKAKNQILESKKIIETIGFNSNPEKKPSKLASDIIYAFARDKAIFG